MGKMRFFRCSGCGNFIYFLGEKTNCTPKCCGEPMTELTPNTTDAAAEKHVPDVTVVGNMVAVKVGSTLHPATAEHHIDFVCLETEKGGQIHYFEPTEEPSASFLLPSGDKPVAVYAYCNLHGLWMKDLAEIEPSSDKLVAYFAAGTGMEKLAAEVALAAKADSYEICPETPYTAADIDWTDAGARSNVEMQDESARPAIKGSKDISKYSTIYLGFPIWWNKPPRIINTFLESADFAGKKIVPFCISGGSNTEGIDVEFEKIAPNGASIVPAKLLNGRPTEAELTVWVEKV